MSKILGITGEIGCGKTTICDYICRKYEFEQYAFAEPIKSIAKCFGFTHTELYGTQSQKLGINAHWGISGRVFMQKFGTDICRNVLPTVIPEMKLDDSSMWIKLYKINLEEKIKKNKNTKLIVSDVRFVNESNAIQENKNDSSKYKKRENHLVFYSQDSDEITKTRLKNFRVFIESKIKQFVIHFFSQISICNYAY